MATTTRNTSTPSRSRTAATKKTTSAVKPAAKPAAKRKPAAKTKVPMVAAVPAPAAAAKASAQLQATPVKVQEVEKIKKPKLVRDSFTMPKAEYAAIDELKQRANKLGLVPKKSELLRAGLMQLTALGDTALTKALAAVPAIKTGRPKA